ncbi:hypothetical protein GCM10009582_02590 [Arthrobacter flavus]
MSVSSQKDSQEALIAKERLELETEPEAELVELAGIYQSKGLSPDTAHQVAVELTKHDALGAHLEAELGLREDAVASPLAAAGASALAFTLGAILPLLTILLFPEETRVLWTFGAVLIALAITGYGSARIGDNPATRPTVRIVLGGALALAATFLIGSLLGTTGVV